MRKLFYTSLFVFALASCFENYALIMERSLSKEDQALERMPESELQYYIDRPENVDVRKDNFLLLNLAVGGNFPGIHDINKVTALNNGPVEMEVDYVRVFQKK